MGIDSLLKERQTRIHKVISLEKPDRTPVVLLYALFAAKITGRPFSDFCSSVAESAEIMIEAFEKCGGDADGLDYLGFPLYSLCYAWMSKVKAPGKELPDDVSYQMAEAELMKIEDYDTILDKGWIDFYQDFMETRVVNDVDPKVLPQNQPPFNPKAALDPLGIPVLTAGPQLIMPFEMLCGGRSMTKFIHDLYTIPDKVEEVMKVIMPTISKVPIEITRQVGTTGIWVGGWRSASINLAPKIWDRFVWPYLRQLAIDAIDGGLIAIFHVDSDWTRDLERFRELPRGKCILATDGFTDLFKAKEILGDHMCLMGDIPPSKLSMGTPDEVYEYSTRLIRELGPEGFILHSGCDIPVNAKLENVKAMISAATGK